MDTQKKYEELTIRDPFMFGKICSIEENRKLILDSLLEIDFKEKNGEIEKYVKAYKSSKASRLDLLVQDIEDKIYNAEMQNKSTSNDQIELPHRSRYYQSNLDTAYFESGKDYITLPETYIIFICTFDPFGKGEPYYRFETKCVNADVENYNEHAYKIFFNTTGNLEKLPISVRNMLSYIETGVATDEATNTLDNEIYTARVREDWKADYMLTLVHDIDVKREGIREGIEEGRKSRQAEVDQLTADIASLSATVESQAAKLQKIEAFLTANGFNLSDI